MAETLKPDPIALRGFILCEYLQNRPIFNAFNNLCAKFGDDSMDYVEFEFWFMRFVKRDFNLHYDRSKDPKQLTFSELPTDMLGEVVKFLDPKERKIARKVSKTLCNVVDRQKIYYKEIEVFIGSTDKITVAYNKNTVAYKGCPTGSIIELGGYKKSIDKFNYVDLAFNDLAISLKPSRILVKSLRVSIEEKSDIGVINQFLNLIRSIHNGFLVKETLIETANTTLALSILSVLKPGTLETIEMFTAEGKAENHERIVEMEQFKQAKTVLLRRFGIFDPSYLQRFNGFRRFQLVLNTVEPRDIYLLREVLLQSPHFLHGSIITSNVPLDYIKIGEALGSRIVDSVATLYDKIPGTTDTLKITISVYDVLFCRYSQ